MTAADTGHQCPRRGCKRRVQHDKLMCGACWFSLPKPIRTQVWQAWDGGRGALSEEHLTAMQAAIDHLPPLGEPRPATYH